MAREMKILGFNIVKINAEKHVEFKGELKLSTNIRISSVEKHKIDLIKDEVLKIFATFEISYGGLGKIELSDILFLLVDPKTQKEALKSWEDEKLSGDLQESILNIILQKSSLRALQIEEDLGLPLHISMPRLSANKKD